MSEPSISIYRRWVVLGCIILVALAVGLVGFGSLFVKQQAQQRIQERIAAATRWQAVVPARYQLVMLENNCRYESTVMDDVSMIAGYPPNCYIQPSTVSALFELIERDGKSEQLCDIRGCPCESFTEVWAAYNAQFGYPEWVAVQTTLRPAWFSADLWNHLMIDKRLPPCSSVTRTEIRVLSMTPLQ